METYHYNGERWCCNRMSLLKRIRRWFIWIGGWEKANGIGWQFYILSGKRRILMSPTPVALLGHRLIHYGWGIDVKLKRNWFCFHWGNGKARNWRCYISKDGTPSKAHCWFVGTPRKVVIAAMR